MDRTRAFQNREQVTELVLNQRNYSKLKDIAHRIWMDTRAPNANLIMLEALRTMMLEAGLEPKFRIDLGVNKYV